MKNREQIKKIDPGYIKNNYVQIGIPYTNNLTLFNNDTILYHHSKCDDLLINKYILDDRKECFPYSNIPVHHNKSGITYIKQILDIEEPYIQVNGNVVIENYLIKDDGDVFLISEKLNNYKNIIYLSTKDVLKIIDKSLYPHENVYFINIDGKLLTDNKIDFISDICNYNEIKNTKKINIFKEILNNDKNNNEEKSIYIIRTTADKIIINKIYLYYISKDKYKVKIFNIPVNKYTISKLENYKNTFITKHPLLSMNIQKEENKKINQLTKKNDK